MKILKFSRNGILPKSKENLNLQKIKSFLMPKFNKNKLRKLKK